MAYRQLPGLLSSAVRYVENAGALASSCRAFASLASSKEGKAMHPDLLNEAVKKTQYAVRGELYLRAMQLQDDGMSITFTNGAGWPA